jgi:hypothetical protein
MAITDIQISEELETNAPSIKYSGNEGPKSPQEMEQMADALLKDEYDQYVYDLLEQRPDATPMSFDEFRQMVIAEGQMSKGPVLPNDPTEPVNPFQPKPQGPVLPNRQMAAYGGIMGVDGRRRYGIGSKLKKFVRKVIPNEVAEVAVKAAPFVAPFNPAVAAAMAGIGGFDQTGRIGSSLKNAAMTYGLGQLGRQVGGAGMQGNPFTQGGAFRGGLEGFKAGFSSPMAAASSGINIDKGRGSALGNKYRSGVVEDPTGLFAEGLTGAGTSSTPITAGGSINIDKVSPLKKFTNKIMDYVPTSFGDVNPFGENFDIKKAAGAFGIYQLGKELLGTPKEVEETIMSRGDGLDLDSIRLEVREAFKDPSGNKLAALRNKYPYLGTQASKDVANMAMGGRIGFADGTKPSGEENTPSQEIINKQIQQIQQMSNMGADIDTIKTITGASDELISMYFGKAMGGRIGKAEGGIMDLGGMEKDYRAEGGFVPIGREEKADDVPARLSVNEFVFTADAVRNAGGGDIDKGAEVMENMMKHLEQGGQVSDESQGMAGAQQMFETSERLSEVI